MEQVGLELVSSLAQSVTTTISQGLPGLLMGGMRRRKGTEDEDDEDEEPELDSDALVPRGAACAADEVRAACPGRVPYAGKGA